MLHMLRSGDRKMSEQANVSMSFGGVGACPRCKRAEHGLAIQHPSTWCEARLTAAEAAERAGMKEKSWARLCAPTPLGPLKRSYGVPADWPREKCPDGRLRSFWKPETVDAFLASRPGRGAGGGRPRKPANWRPLDTPSPLR